jgi:hypothetical protein
MPVPSSVVSIMARKIVIILLQDQPFSQESYSLLFFSVTWLPSVGPQTLVHRNMAAPFTHHPLPDLSITWLPSVAQHPKLQFIQSWLHLPLTRLIQRVKKIPSKNINLDDM